MALYASRSLRLASPSDYGTTPLRRESSSFHRLLNTCADGKSRHDGFLHTFTVLPNNVISGCTALKFYSRDGLRLAYDITLLLYSHRVTVHGSTATFVVGGKRRH